MAALYAKGQLCRHPKNRWRRPIRQQEILVFLEKWQAHNQKEACFAGTSHVRLVAGMYQKQDRQTFLAKAFDLMKDPGGKPGDKYIGSSWSANSDTWWADHYNIDDDGKDEDVANWKKVSKPNSYETFGEVKGGVVKEGHEGQDGLADIYKYLQQQGEELQKKSQPYNVIGKVAGNNCITEALLKTITVDKEKCE